MRKVDARAVSLGIPVYLMIENAGNDSVKRSFEVLMKCYVSSEPRDEPPDSTIIAWKQALSSKHIVENVSTHRRTANQPAENQEEEEKIWCGFD